LKKKELEILKKALKKTASPFIAPRGFSIRGWPPVKKTVPPSILGFKISVYLVPQKKGIGGTKKLGVSSS
jgi:hypothetical protein